MNNFSLKYNPMFQSFNNSKLIDNSILLERESTHVNQFQYNTHIQHQITSKHTLAG